jgi:hypothetical protein
MERGACGRDRMGMSAAPPLLPMFVLAMLAMVGAVVVVGQTDSGWADVGAVALLLVTLGLVLRAILSRLSDD